MKPILAYIFRFAIAMIGYAAAVIVSVLVSVALFLALAALPGTGGQDLFLGSPGDFAFLVEYGLVVTAVFAFPGFVIALVLSIVQRWERWSSFAIAGCANVVFALAIFGGWGNGSITNIPIGLILPCIPGGFAGGYIYWLVAGRFLARHRAAKI
jgi:preprotein translocase subunit SecG